ncbi:MAG: hypothetical protein HKM93_21840 [Desulfobacteraceae bacterium]|nr:hypothetical protein [Desulfobacteraceae bacterium]
MPKQFSFTKDENKIIGGYRQRLNQAESTEDVRKCFTYTVSELFEKVFEGNLAIDDEDIVLAPASSKNYTIHRRLFNKPAFRSIWIGSDLPRVVSRFADSAANRCKRLEKHPEKTDSKIRM